MAVPTIRQISICDIMSRLPSCEPVDNDGLHDDSIDVLICALGFEDRATAIVDDVPHAKIENLLLVSYPTNSSDNAASADEFRRLRVQKVLEPITYDRVDFSGALKRRLDPFKGKERMRLVVDISGMASYVLYRLLHTVFTTLRNCELGVYYAEADEYFPREDEWNRFLNEVPDRSSPLEVAERYEQVNFQSKGTAHTYESDVFPGKNIGPLATELIAIPSFSLQRMKSMITFAQSRYSLSPAEVRWLLGDPPNRDKNGWRLEALAKLYIVKENGIAVSTIDYKHVLEELDDLWQERFAERHLVIATLGSKMQHLGTFLFLWTHSEVGLILNEPREFMADRYSKGVGPRWLVDFGLVDSVHSVLQSRGMLEFNWEKKRG